MAKKLVERPPLTVAVTTTSTFHLEDAISRRSLLVDTGASRSIFPPTNNRKPAPKDVGFRLIAANGSNIDTYGWKDIPIKFNNKTYSWRFLIADVKIPLLGADFLSHYDLLVDVRQRRLIDTATFQATKLTASATPTPISAVQQGLYSHVFQEFPQVFKPELRQSPGAPSKHGVYHHIKTTGPPVFSRYRRLHPSKFKAARDAFNEMEDLGICQKAASPWASPLHLVTKADGTWRPCGDYRRLNMLTEPDHYPLPNISDVTSSLHGSKIFSKLDLLKGYFQVPVHPDDIPKTAIITPFGTYTFNYSCFGLRNSGATFQRLMDGILGDLDFCVCYVDDILIFSNDKQQHLEHLRTVLQRLQDNGLILRSDKCDLGSTSVVFLGHHITAEGVTPLSSKVEAVKKFPIPKSVKQLQEFIGMINFYHRFLPGIARTLTPLYNSLKGKPKTLPWGPQQEAAFQKAKEALTKATTLAFPAPDAKLQLSTDASDTALGAVLEQLIHGRPQPLGFFSRKLSPAETKYSTFDRELLAIHMAVRHFRHLLEGTTFTINTDHQPIVHAFTKQTDAWSARQRRHLSAISEFNCEMRYIPGTKNPVADALSRISIDAVTIGLDYQQLAKLQAEDPETEMYKTSITSLQWQDFPLDDENTRLLCDVSTGRPRPLVPEPLRKKVFSLVHSLAHPSGRATAKLLKDRFIWHGITRDAKSWAKSCTDCQTSKIQRHTTPPLGSLPQPTRRFQHIHVDIVGPLPFSNGFRYLFTTIDRSTRWPEAIPMQDATASSCTQALLNWISRFGIPDHITSDRGTPFTSQLWTSLAALLGFTPHHTTSYHPQSNGMVERFHRTLKASLMASCADDKWHAQLPWVLLGLRTTAREDNDASPAERVFGQTLVVPGEFFPSNPESQDIKDLRHKVADFAPVKQTYRDKLKTHIPDELSKATHVFVRVDSHRRPLSKPYTGPYKVIARRPNTFQLEINGKIDWVAIDRLKPAYLPSNDSPPITFSRAGRPIRRRT